MLISDGKPSTGTPAQRKRSVTAAGPISVSLLRCKLNQKRSSCPRGDQAKKPGLEGELVNSSTGW